MSAESIPLKQCSRKENCINPLGSWLPETVEYFGAHKRMKNGLTAMCRVCLRAREHERQKDPKRREWQKQYAAKPERRAYQREYNHSENGKAAQRRHNKSPSRKAYVREWQRRHRSTPEYKAADAKRAREYREIKRLDPEWREHVRAYQKDYGYEWRRRPERQAIDKARRQRPEKKAYSREYGRRYRRTSDRYRVYIAEYGQRDYVRLRRKEQEWKRASRLKSVPMNFTATDWRRALEYFNGICPVCERPFRDLFGERKPHADHWIPLSKGGATVPTNIVPLCGGTDACNQSKADRLPHEWLAWKFGKRRAAQILTRINAYFEWVREQDGD